LSYNLAYTATEAAAATPPATNGSNSRRRRYAARFYPQIADWPALTFLAACAHLPLSVLPLFVCTAISEKSQPKLNDRPFRAGTPGYSFSRLFTM